MGEPRPGGAGESPERESRAPGLRALGATGCPESARRRPRPPRRARGAGSSPRGRMSRCGSECARGRDGRPRTGQRRAERATSRRREAAATRFRPRSARRHDHRNGPGPVGPGGKITKAQERAPPGTRAPSASHRRKVDPRESLRAARTSCPAATRDTATLAARTSPPACDGSTDTRVRRAARARIGKTKSRAPEARAGCLAPGTRRTTDVARPSAGSSRTDPPTRGSRSAPG